MKSPWPGILLAVGAVAALVLIVVLVRSGRQDERLLDQPSQGAEQKQRSERVQQRLDELHEARSHGAQGETTGQIEARSEAPIVPRGKQGMTRPRPAVEQPAKGGGRAPADSAAGTVESEPIPFDEDPDDIPTLTRISLQDSNPERRLAAVTLLGASDDPQVIPVLAQALSDQDEEVRLAAVQSLSDFTDEAAVDAVEPALNDRSADIRYEALEVLSDLDSERARPFVERALNDPDEEVRALAESLLDADEPPERTPGATLQPRGGAARPSNE